jgi:hypothetical protein
LHCPWYLLLLHLLLLLLLLLQLNLPPFLLFGLLLLNDLPNPLNKLGLIRGDES